MSHIPLGIGFAPSVPAPRVIEAAQLAEHLGFDVFWITDSHLAAREAMAMLGALAVSTKRIHLGTGVSHLAGRHFSVIASSMVTLDELAPGRIRLGIGVGDSGPLNLGIPRTRLRELESAVVGIRDLMQGREADGPSSERKLKLGYLRGGSVANVPIYISGSAERTHRLTGRVADGALVSGMPRELPTAIQSVRAGEREAGRPPGATRILLWTTVAVDDDREAARAAVRGSVARRALNALGLLARAGQLGADDAEALARLQAAHARGHLTEVDYHDLVPERWIDRFAIAGTRSEVLAGLQRGIQDGAEEISMILMAPPTPSAVARGSADQLTRFAETVMAPLRSALGTIVSA
jgi:alkanesulfonate monooxygenase SsuD/methylene tetrahydromethanopterin reductase-like flavin-dependent oxidoreductase (luciferase family)